MKSKAIKHFGTVLLKTVNDTRTTSPHQLPIYATAAFEFQNIEQGIEIFQNQPGAHVYSRYGNPTVEAVAQKIADLEAFGSNQQGYGLLTSSGMAAIHCVLQTLLKPGDVILTQSDLYGGTTELFKTVFGQNQVGIEFLEFKTPEEVDFAIRKHSGRVLVYLESPTNPVLKSTDIQMVSSIAKLHGVRVIVDNTFSTPYGMRPLSLGADVVIHSTTKFLHGHGASTGGAIVSFDKELINNRLWVFLKLIGSVASPFEAFLLHLGLKTLEIRMQAQSSNAQKLAEFLQKHPKVNKVNYPGLLSHPDHVLASKQMHCYGAILSFEIKGGIEEVSNVLKKIKLCAIAPSLGETDTMILHPATMSHLKVPKDIRLKNGITDGLIRLSVGLETIDDLILDWNQALEGI